MKKKRLHGGMSGEEVNPPPPYFQKYSTIWHEICSPVYLQLSIVTWHIIGFHGNHSNIMASLVAAILHFFQIQIQTLKIVRKQHLAIGIYKILRSIVKLSVFR